MRIVLQRVKKASVSIDDRLYSSIGNGYMLLVGIENDDTSEDIEWLAAKICSMRIFSDEEGKMNLDIKQVNGEILIVSQFTLHASTKKGNRPSFIKAARPEVAKVVVRLETLDAARARAAAARRITSAFAFADSPIPTAIICFALPVGTTSVCPTFDSNPSALSWSRVMPSCFDTAPSVGTATPIAWDAISDLTIVTDNWVFFISAPIFYTFVCRYNY